MRKRLALSIAFAAACSSAETYPPPLGDCPTCTGRSIVIIGPGKDSGTDATVDASNDAAIDASNDAAIDASTDASTDALIDAALDSSGGG